MSSRDYQAYNPGRHRCLVANRADTRTPSRPTGIETSEREGAERAERARRQRAEIHRQLEGIRAAALMLGGDDAEGANGAEPRRNDRAADNNDRPERGNIGLEAPRAAAFVLNDVSSVGDSVALSMRDEGAANNNERSVEESLQARAAAIVARPRGDFTDNRDQTRRNDGTARNNGDRADRAENRAPGQERDSKAVWASVARAAFPHMEEERGAQLARRDGEDRASASARRLHMEEEELLWGPRLLRNDGAAGNIGDRADRVENPVPGNERDNAAFSAAVARAALPHVDQGCRAVLARALGDGEDRASAIARQLLMEEEEELLWGPRLHARRRSMMAQRAIRGGQLETLDALIQQDLMIARLEAMELRVNLDRITPRHSTQRPWPPPDPPVPRHLRELRELEHTAKIQPSSILDGLELVVPSSDFDAEDILIKRVTACVGWAIHGLIFELTNGSRMGTLLVNPGEKPMELNDKNLSDRACVGWTDIEYGDYIVGMHGDRLADGVQKWFCYSLTLQFASGRNIHYEANHEPWRGEPFDYTVPQPCYVHRISFKNGQKEDMLGLVTSIHLPMSRKTFKHLPLKQQRAVEDMLQIGCKVDLGLENSGRKPMGEDVWWLILGFLRGWELLPPSPNVKGSKDGQRLFELYAKRHEYNQIL